MRILTGKALKMIRIWWLDWRLGRAFNLSLQYSPFYCPGRLILTQPSEIKATMFHPDTVILGYRARPSEIKTENGFHPDEMVFGFHWAPIAGSTLRSDRRGKHFTPVPSAGATPEE